MHVYVLTIVSVSQAYSNFRMQSLAYLEHSSASSGSSFSYSGELLLHQREPLNHRGRDVRYDVREPKCKVTPYY